MGLFRSLVRSLPFMVFIWVQPYGLTDWQFYSWSVAFILAMYLHDDAML